jgi:hypothetical protein
MLCNLLPSLVPINQHFELSCLYYLQQVEYSLSESEDDLGWVIYAHDLIDQVILLNLVNQTGEVEHLLH